LKITEKGQVMFAKSTTPSRLVAKKMGFRESVDFDQLGVQSVRWHFYVKGERQEES
jgi:hypothetical protein